MLRRSSRYGFTLPELMIVLAIVALLSAILFPVFRAAKVSAYRTVCATQFKQAQLAVMIYTSDYDDRFMPASHHPGEKTTPSADRTWVQLLLPYTGSFPMFRCPADHGARDSSDPIIEDGLVAGDAYARYYYASQRVNIGYNYLLFSPVYRAGGVWQVETRTNSDFRDPSQVLLFVDSVYALDGFGNPYGGGSYLVIPPCRYSSRGGQLIDSFGLPPRATVFAASQGWVISNPKSAFRYGFAWPWHDGRMNIARAGGGSVPMTIEQLSLGCDVRSLWQGLIDDNTKYYWDLY